MFIIDQSDERLVLREYPLLAWLFGGAFIVGSGNLWLLGAELSAFASIVLGIFLFLWAQVRTITFDRNQGTLTVRLFAVLRHRIPLQAPLNTLRGASVREFDTGHTQIVLHFHTQPDTGLSVYSRDIADWKTPLAEAINDVIQHTELNKR